jgi:hypothetical protein
MCPLPSDFFPSICNMYTTSPATYRKDISKKWNIYCRFEYIGPSFPSSILDQIPLSFSPLLSLSRYLVVFPKMSQCPRWPTQGFTFSLMLLYHDSNQPLAIRCLGTFQIADSRAGGLYIALPCEVNDKACDLRGYVLPY